MAASWFAGRGLLAVVFVAAAVAAVAAAVAAVAAAVAAVAAAAAAVKESVCIDPTFCY